jgi:hypothetical protein
MSLKSWLREMFEAGKMRAEPSPLPTGVPDHLHDEIVQRTLDAMPKPCPNNFPHTGQCDCIVVPTKWYWCPEAFSTEIANPILSTPKYEVKLHGKIGGVDVVGISPQGFKDHGPMAGLLDELSKKEGD